MATRTVRAAAGTRATAAAAAGTGADPVVSREEQGQADPGTELLNEATPGLGRKDRYPQDERASSGGLSDDPTESGEPVRNKVPFTITRER